jgi:hypothetical protein
MKHAGSVTVISSIALLLGSSIGITSAQTIDRVRASDQTLDCSGITQESKPLDSQIAAGDANNGAVTRSAAGAAAGVGGQIGGSLLGGLFGPLGSVIGGATSNAAARQATESSMAPDAAARQRAGEAAARKDFLTRLAVAKGCKGDDPSYVGKTLTPEEFEQVAGTLAAGKGLAKVTPFTLATITPVLSENVTPYPMTDLFDGKLPLKGKRFYIAEFRVLFDVGGEVSASTRACYLPGRDYGATSMRVTYTVPNVDIAAFQAITDKAYADFLARIAAAGVKLEDADTFVRENGAVYETTEQPSRPGAPVMLEKNGRKYLVTAPAGMKLHSRGFAGLGAGNIGKRIDFTKNNLEGLSITMAVNVAALESSGSGSSIFRRGSSADAKESMSVTQGPDALVVQTHANSQGVRMTKPVQMEGSFANFREVGGYDSSKDVAARAAAVISHLGGVASNQRKRVDMEVDLDGPATSRLALRGIATINQALADNIKAGL